VRSCGQCDDGTVVAPPRDQSPYPSATQICLAGNAFFERGPRTVYEQAPQVAVASFADPLLTLMPPEEYCLETRPSHADR
jgi:hypothetical protein